MVKSICIVISDYYKEISDGLETGATNFCDENSIKYKKIYVPGALEIGPAIKIISDRDSYDGFIALGCVIRGETSHFDIVINESARAITNLNLDYSLSIANGILTVENKEQAIERSCDNKNNKGYHAALACSKLIDLKGNFNLKSDNHNKKSSARLFAVQILFEMEINGKKINNILERLTDEYLIEISRLNKTEKADKNHLIKILKGVIKNQKDIDLNIKDNLIGWSLSRIDSVSRAILRSALYELRECNDIPVKVIINEYIEISKSFFEGDEPNFINGILDKISKIYRPNEF